MSLLLFEGAAGTGKTTRLRAEARAHLEQQPLGPDQSVLALTKYHGSRRRIDVALRDRSNGVGNALECMTIDSFAWNLVTRWRALGAHLGLQIAQGDFAAVSAAAAELLRRPHVAKWLSRRYPLVIVDEMQDCSESEVSVLQGLEPHVRLLCAADAFQDLSGPGHNVAIEWAASVGDVAFLSEVHRTHNAALLAAAQALRTGKAVPSNKDAGFDIVPAPMSALAGATVCWRIRSWAKHGQVVLISGTTSGTSPFVDAVVDWVCAKTSTSKKTKATAGPYPIAWESDDASAGAAMLNTLQLSTETTTLIDCTELAERAHSRGLHELGDWARRQMFVRGLASVTVADVIDEVGRIVRRLRAFGPNRPWSRRVMTIHQAKNREFESVIVLWPLKLRGDEERKRRLLYNAVTRARGRALVIVEAPKKQVMAGPLFVGSA